MVPLAVLLSGCLGGGTGVGKAGSITSGATGPPTLDTVLEALPHYKVVGPATLELEINELGREGYGYNASLVHFFVPVKPGVQKFTNNPLLILAIPFEAEKTLQGCEKIPKSLHWRFGPVAGNGAGNLTGEYKPGWYHLVMISTTTGGYRVTYNSTKELKTRAPIALDPFVQVGLKTVTGKRSYDETYPMDSPWFAWTQFFLNANTIDGGRDFLVQLNSGGACDVMAINQQLPDPAAVTSSFGAKRVWAAGMGAEPSATVHAEYKPKVEQAAPTDVLLQTVWVRPSTPPVPAAPDPAASPK